MTLIVGEDVRVAAASDVALLGLKGKVVLETMHTLTIRTKMERKVMLPKAGSALEMSGGEIILGDDIKGRLEDRIALIGRPTGRGGARMKSRRTR
jgi:RNase P/RNase MRP subunit p29